MADRRRRRNSASESDNDANAATDAGAPSEDVLPVDDKKEAPTANAAAADGAAADGNAESDEEEEAYDEEYSDSQEAEGDGEELSEEGDEGEDLEGEEGTEDDEDSEGEEETDGEEEIAEGEPAKEGDSVKQRESGDGQEQTEASVLDDDEDTKNPAYIPRKGLFYEHDLRLEDDGETAARKNGAPERPKKKLWSDADKWLHDRYDDSQQRPKSREELISIYGFDIRERDAPPDDSVAMLRGRGRGSRGYGSRGGRRPYRLGDYVQPSQRQRVYSREDRSQRNEDEEQEEGEERLDKGERAKRIAEDATVEPKNVAARSSSSGGEQEQQRRWTTPSPQPMWQRGQRGSRGGYRGAPGTRGGREEGARRGGSSTGAATADSAWIRGRRTEWGPSRPSANRGQTTEPEGPTAVTPAVVSTSESRSFRSGGVPSESRQGPGVAAEMPEKAPSAGGNVPATAGPTLSAATGDGSRAPGDASSDAVVAPAKVVSNRRGDSSATLPARADVPNRRADQQGGSGGPSARHPSHRQQQRDVRQDSGSAQGVRTVATSEADAKGSSQQQQQAKPKRYSTQRQRASSPPSSQRQPATVPPADMDATIAGAAPAAKNLEFYSSQHPQAPSVQQQQQQQAHPAAGYVQHSGGITSLPMAATQQQVLPPPAAMMHSASPMAYGGSLPMGSLHAGTPRLLYAHMAPPAADQGLSGPRLSAQAAAAAQYLPAAPGAAPGIMQPGAAVMYNIPTHPGSHPTPAGLPSGAATYVLQPPPPGTLPVSYGSPGSRTQIVPGPQPGQEGFSLGGTTYYGAPAMMQPPDVISAGPQYYGDATAAVTSHNNMFYYVTPQPASRTPSRRPKAAIPIMRPEEAIGMTQAGGEGLTSGTDGAERLAMHSNAGPSVVEYNHAAAGEPGYFAVVPAVYEAGTAVQFGATKAVAHGSYNSSLAGRPPDAMAAASSAAVDSRVAAVDARMAAISLGSTEVVSGAPSS